MAIPPFPLKVMVLDPDLEYRQHISETLESRQDLYQVSVTSTAADTTISINESHILFMRLPFTEDAKQLIATAKNFKVPVFVTVPSKEPENCIPWLEAGAFFCLPMHFQHFSVILDSWQSRLNCWRPYNDQEPIEGARFQWTPTNISLFDQAVTSLEHDDHKAKPRDQVLAIMRQNGVRGGLSLSTLQNRLKKKRAAALAAPAEPELDLELRL